MLLPCMLSRTLAGSCLTTAEKSRESRLAHYVKTRKVSTTISLKIKGLTFNETMRLANALFILLLSALRDSSGAALSNLRGKVRDLKHGEDEAVERGEGKTNNLFVLAMDAPILNLTSVFDLFS
jgi:hypothetical protein